LSLSGWMVSAPFLLQQSSHNSPSWCYLLHCLQTHTDLYIPSLCPNHFLPSQPDLLSVCYSGRTFLEFILGLFNDCFVVICRLQLAQLSWSCGNVVLHLLVKWNCSLCPFLQRALLTGLFQCLFASSFWTFAVDRSSSSLLSFLPMTLQFPSWDTFRVAIDLECDCFRAEIELENSSFSLSNFWSVAYTQNSEHRSEHMFTHWHLYRSIHHARVGHVSCAIWNEVIFHLITLFN